MEEIQTLIEKVRADLNAGKREDEIFLSIQPVWGRNPRADECLAESLASLADVRVANLLQRMHQTTDERRGRKMIKRALYRLQSRGIVPDAGPQEKRRESILRPLQKEPARGYGTCMDYLGNRLMIVVLHPGGRGLTVLQGVISDTDGLIDFSGQEMSRKGVKELLEEMPQKTPLPFVEMEASYVGFLLVEAYHRAVSIGKTPPQDFARWKGELERVRRPFERPLIYSLLSKEEVAEDDRILGRAGDLLDADLFSGWRIEEDIRPYAEAVLEAETSKLVLNQAQKEARIQEIYLRALSELFRDERRAIYKQRMEEMAYVLLRLGRQEEARTALASAIELEKEMNPFRPHPFFHSLVVRSILLVVSESHEQRQKEPSLIVRP